jgi:hypothetical protein
MSIRVAGSAKLGDYGNPMRLVGNATRPGMYVSCHFDEGSAMLPPVVSMVHYGAGVIGRAADYELIMQQALGDSSIRIKTIKPLDEFYVSVIIKNFTTCTRGGGGSTEHSKDDDIFFKVSLYDPTVVQSCFSDRCKELPVNDQDYTHSMFFCEGICSDVYSDGIAQGYIDEVDKVIHSIRVPGKKEDSPPRELKPTEMKKMLEHWQKILFRVYYNRFFGVITDDGKALIAVQYKDSDGRNARRVIQPNEFLLQRVAPALDKWVKTCSRTTYKHYVHIPWHDSMIKMSCCGGGEDYCENDEFDRDAVMESEASDDWLQVPRKLSQGNFNLFMRLGVTHKEALDWHGDDPEHIREVVAPIIEHITNVWCGANVRAARWVIQWLAINYLEPWRKLGSAIVLQSGKGTGKGIIMNKMRDILNGDGRADGVFWQINTMEPLTGSYQPLALIHTGLLFADECIWSGDPRVANAIKGLVTEENMNCNAKYLPSKSYRSTMNIVIASNNARAIEFTVDNRRFQMLDMKEHVFTSQEAKNDYFKKIADVPSTALAAFFMRCVCLCDFDPNQMFNNGRSAAEGVLESSPFDAWWHDLLSGDTELDLFSHDRYPLSALKADYEASVKHKRGAVTHYPTVSSFGKALRRRLGMKQSDSWGRSLRNHTGNRVAALIVPLREMAQKAFNLFTKQNYKF